jgi:hypothetical protein
MLSADLGFSSITVTDLKFLPQGGIRLSISD